MTGFQPDPRRVALLVIDMQNDFCQPEGFFAQAGHDVSTCAAAVEATKKLLEQVRPRGIRVFWTRSINQDPPQHTLPPLRFRAERASDDFTAGLGGTESFPPNSWGSEIVAELCPLDGECIIDKASYDGFYLTPLEAELRAGGIDVLAVAGVTTNCCVDTTVRSAYMRGFSPFVLTDCVASFGNEWDLHDAALRNMSLLFGVTGDSAQLLESLPSNFLGGRAAAAGSS